MPLLRCLGPKNYPSHDTRAAVPLKKVTTETFASIDPQEKQHIRSAAQSGPMLMIDDSIHYKFIHRSKNLQLRSGVGIMPNGNVVFIISQSNQTNVHDIAAILKTAMHVYTLTKLKPIPMLTPLPQSFRRPHAAQFPYTPH